MTQLTSHEKYEIYKHCLSLGISEEVAVKVRENADSSLHFILHSRLFEHEIEDVLYGAFYWEQSPEGFEFWEQVLEQLVNKGETI